MMKTIFRTLLPLLATLLLSFPAHAGFFGKEEWEKEDCPKKHSLAWCLADYQGFSEGVFDDTKEEFSAKLKKAGVTDESKIADILHTGLGTGIAISEFAFGSLFGGSMFLLSAVLPSRAELNKKHAYMVFLGDATTLTEKQVGDEYRTALDKAVRSALASLPKEAVVTEIERGVQEIKIPGFECKNRLDCTVYYKNPENLVRFEKKDTVPLYLNLSSVFSTKPGVNVGIAFFHLPKGVNSATLAKAISENLPASYYWFIPAGYLGGNPFPMFLNQGKAMFFVKPTAEDPIPVLPHVATKVKPDEKPVGQSVPLPMAEPPAAAINTSSLGN